jgi:Mg-chelatase subunit ChlD
VPVLGDILSGSNTYTGGTALNAGATTITSGTTFSGTVSGAAGTTVAGTGGLTINGGTLATNMGENRLTVTSGLEIETGKFESSIPNTTDVAGNRGALISERDSAKKDMSRSWENLIGTESLPGSPMSPATPTAPAAGTGGDLAGGFTFGSQSAAGASAGVRIDYGQPIPAADRKAAPLPLSAQATIPPQNADGWAFAKKSNVEPELRRMEKAADAQSPILGGVALWNDTEHAKENFNLATKENHANEANMPAVVSTEVSRGAPVSAELEGRITGNTQTSAEKSDQLRHAVEAPKKAAAAGGKGEPLGKAGPLPATVDELVVVEKKAESGAATSTEDLSRMKANSAKNLGNTDAPAPTASAKPLEMAKLRMEELQKQLQEQTKKLKYKEAEPEREQVRPAQPAAEPQPEVATSANVYSTFSLNVTDVGFKLAAASLEQGRMPEPATVRSEEFINAFDYRDPEPNAGAPLAFASERARYPFAQNRDLLRLSVKTAAAGRQPGRALNIVLLLDNSGSMERADRVRILREALRVLCTQLQPKDKLSVVTFARTPRLWADGVAGDKAGEVTSRVGEITPQGGTNLAAALDLGYATALRHYQVGSINRVVLITDGAANLGDVDPDALKQKVEAHRKQGVALDCFGIGWEGLDDTLLEALSRNGDGRYGFINSPEEAATEFAGQLAGALRVAASDVKVQVEFNPRRVTAYRQIGYAKHQLTKEQFRDNTVDAAEIGAAEAGNALYVVEVNPRGEGDLATVRVRFKVPGTSDYREHEWTVPFTSAALPLEQASPALRLAGSASAFAEWLVASPYAAEVTTDRLLGLLNGVPAIYGADPRPKKLEWMIRTAKSVSGR